MNSNSLRLLLFLLIGLGSVSIVKAEDFSLGKIEAWEETSEMLTPFSVIHLLLKIPFL